LVSLIAKKGRQVGWVEERNPTKDIGMVNPTFYEYAMTDVRTKSQTEEDGQGIWGRHDVALQR
jgi:hypothetical protein